MKTLADRDIGKTKCKFKAEGATDEEVIDKVFQHWQQSHPEDNITREEIANRSRGKIRGS